MRQRMQETLYQDRRCRSLSIRHQMQGSLLQTADAGVSVLDSRCRRYSIRQRMQDTFYQAADAGLSLSDSGCRSQSIR